MELPVPDEFILGDSIGAEYRSLTGIGVGNGLQGFYFINLNKSNIKKI
ncbi:hypothetical protein HMPREF0023_2166 [Acinetobacter sp. ATCC 27244]|nr:hypothetical protein HMPREF0023_2166 [Acinetobacter sp. ATCC 27244]